MAQTPEEYAGVDNRDCSDLTVLITGATSGIGRELALAFGRLGATVVVHGRDTERGEAVVERLHETPASGVQLFCADFAHQKSVRGLAETVRAQFDLDVLVNNAGCYVREPRVTDDGVEYTMAVNHVAPFLLTHELAPALADGRVVTTTSSLHREIDLDLDALTSTDGFRGWHAYRQSKLANVLFTAELDRRTDLWTGCFHPGFVPGSNLFRGLPLPVRLAIRIAGVLPGVGTSRQRGAATGVSLAVAPEREHSGGYFARGQRETPSGTARDATLASRLWERTREIADIDTFGVPTTG